MRFARELAVQAAAYATEVERAFRGLACPPASSRFPGMRGMAPAGAGNTGRGFLHLLPENRSGRNPQHDRSARPGHPG